MTWLQAFVLTQLIELPVYGGLLRETTMPRRIAMGAAVTAATHPWVWFVLPPVMLPWLGYYGYVAVVEVIVIGAEAALLIGFGQHRGRALLGSAVANAASVLVGLAVARWLAP